MWHDSLFHEENTVYNSAIFSQQNWGSAYIYLCSLEIHYTQAAESYFFMYYVLMLTFWSNKQQKNE